MSETATTTTRKFNPFAKAKAVAQLAPAAPKKKETVWVPDNPQLQLAISNVLKYQGELKTADTTQKLAKAAVQAYAEEQYVDALAATGVEPPGPMKVANDKGETVTFVAQDRSGLYEVGDEQYAALEAVVGAEVAEQLCWVGGDYKFNTEVLSRPGVMEKVQEAMGEALGKLELPAEVLEALVEYQPKRRLKPGTLAKAVVVCGSNKARLEAFLAAMGSNLTRYVKA